MFNRKLSDMYEYDLKDCVREAVSEVINELNRAPNDDRKENEPTLLSTKDLCKLLEISRVTLNNWFGDGQTGLLLKQFKHKVRNRNMYDLNGIRRIISEYPGLFKNVENRLDKVRTNDFVKFHRLHNMIQKGKILTDEEKEFHTGFLEKKLGKKIYEMPIEFRPEYNRKL